MGSLFSSFDSLSSIFNFPLNWLSVLVFLLFFPRNFYLKKNKFIKLFYEVINYLFQEIKISIGSVKTPGLGHIFISLFILIVFSNFIGLFPIGTPYPLMPFIVLIEIVRRVIRPLTLSVRLAANMVAGHLLMILIRRPINMLS